MLSRSPAGRAGTPDEVATVGALLMGPDGAFITGSDFLMDGGVTASYLLRRAGSEVRPLLIGVQHPVPDETESALSAWTCRTSGDGEASHVPCRITALDTLSSDG
jgi:hypothetical protein